MKKLLTFVVIYLSFVYTYGQTGYTVTSYNFAPRMDETSGGIWGNWEREIYDTIYKSDSVTIDTILTIPTFGNPDSVYISSVGYPNFGDMYVPDNEVKMKALWNDYTLYFLFQRLDDVYVNGLTESEEVDTTIKEGMDNLDATKIYFYLTNDALVIDSSTYFDSLFSWIQFVWNSDQMQARLPSGEMVYSYDDYYSKLVQWCEGDYCYTKLSIDLNKLKPLLVDTLKTQDDSLNYSYTPFLVESTENDKELMVDDLYQLQTRSYWGISIDSNATDYVSSWPLLYIYKDTINQYVTPTLSVQQNFAEVYPNPASDHINIQLEEFSDVQYYLYDIMGRMVLTGQFYDNSHQVYIDGLSPGSYFLVMRNRSNGSIMNRKILVLRH